MHEARKWATLIQRRRPHPLSNPRRENDESRLPLAAVSEAKPVSGAQNAANEHGAHRSVTNHEAR